MISGAQFDLSKIIDPKNYLHKPKLDQAYLTEILRMIELQNKKNTNLDEDLELQLLTEDINVRPYFDRIDELAFKSDLSAREKKELNLLLHKDTRAHAERILELDDIPNKNYIEDIESTILNTPQLRVHYEEIMPLVTKLFKRDLNTEKEERACFLFTSQYSIKHAHEIMHLESLPNLTPTQMNKLGNDYLLRICQVPLNLHNDVDKNYTGAAYNPNSFCFTYNKKLPTYKRPIALYEETKKTIEKAAQHLAQAYYLKILVDQYNSYKNVSTPEKMLQTSSMQILIKTKQELLSLVLKKIFFDFDAGFAESKLNKLVIHLSKEIDKNRLQLTAKGLTEMYKTLQESLNRIGIDDNNQSLRRR